MLPLIMFVLTNKNGRFDHKVVSPRSLEEGGIKLTPLDFFGFKFLLLDRLSKALAQLFLVCEHIF